jgi:hypothetical protein
MAVAMAVAMADIIPIPFTTLVAQALVEHQVAVAVEHQVAVAPSRVDQSLVTPY